MKRFETIRPVDPERHVYVERAADRLLPQLLENGTHCNVHAGRQAGKTSIMRKVMREFQARDHLCLQTALHVHAINAVDLAEAVRRTTATLAEQFARTRGAAELPHGRDAGNPGDIFVDFLARVENATPSGKRLFVFIDEMDVLLRFRPDEVAGFLYPLREYCQGASQRNVTLLLVSVRTLVDMVALHPMGGVAPFLARDVSLPLFANDRSIHQQLADQGFPDLAFDEVQPMIEEVLRLTGGQPYLTCVLLGELQEAEDHEKRLGEFADQYVDSGADLQGHFDVIRKQLLDSGETLYAIADIYDKILGDVRVTPDSGGISAIRLENIGLVRLSEGEYRSTCPIYERHLTSRWMEEIVQQYDTTAMRRRRPAINQTDKRIALLLTGGTIGMVTEGRQSTFQGADTELNAFIHEELRRVADVRPIKLFEPPLDGINVTPREWKRIADWIASHRGDFHAFVVAHGTDTLAFTASAVAFMFGPGLDCPIVFTGAQTTIDLKHGDTQDNLKRACFVAAHPQASHEVQILFGDLVLRAVRAEKADDRLFEGFRSPAWPPLARVTEHLLINEYALGGRPIDVVAPEYRPFIAQEIVVIPIVPGLRPDLYQRMVFDTVESGRPIDGVIITTPGVGNIPSTDGYNFRPFIHDTVGAGIPVLIASQVPINPYTQAQYEMARVPEEYGAILTGNITPTAAVAKFGWVIGWTRSELGSTADSKLYLDTIRSRMKTNFVGEQSEYEAPDASLASGGIHERSTVQ